MDRLISGMIRIRKENNLKSMKNNINHLNSLSKRSILTCSKTFRFSPEENISNRLNNWKFHLCNMHSLWQTYKNNNEFQKIIIHALLNISNTYYQWTWTHFKFLHIFVFFWYHEKQIEILPSLYLFHIFKVHWFES